MNKPLTHYADDGEDVFYVFEYLYRDTDNFKAFGQLLVSGKITDEYIGELKSHLDYGVFFVAEQVNIPTLYSQLWKYSNGPTISDHTFHEFLSLRPANNLGIVIYQYIVLRSDEKMSLLSCGCKLAYSDRRYSDKWKKKFADNKQRDQRVVSQLRKEGLRVAVIWECTTRRNSEFEDAIKRLDEFIKAGDGWYFETDYRES